MQATASDGGGGGCGKSPRPANMVLPHRSCWPGHGKDRWCPGHSTWDLLTDIRARDAAPTITRWSRRDFWQSASLTFPALALLPLPALQWRSWVLMGFDRLPRLWKFSFYLIPPSSNGTGTCRTRAKTPDCRRILGAGRLRLLLLPGTSLPFRLDIPRPFLAPSKHI